jgi:hypothetical protein
MRPLGICQVARIPQLAAVIARTIFVRPHPATSSESGSAE